MGGFGEMGKEGAIVLVSNFEKEGTVSKGGVIKSLEGLSGKFVAIKLGDSVKDKVSQVGGSE